MNSFSLNTIDDENNEDLARVAVADYMERRHSIPFDEVSLDYGRAASLVGLSGNPVSDYRTLKADREALAARAGRVAKRYNQGPIEKRARNLGASAAEFITSVAAGGLDLLTMNSRVQGRETKGMEHLSSAVRDFGGLSREAYGTNPEFDDKFEAKLTGGAVSLAGMIAAPWTILPVMHEESTRFSEEVWGMKFEDMPDEMREKADTTRGLYMIVGGAMERLGIGFITKRILTGGGTKREIVNILETALVEGSIEEGQHRLLTAMTNHIQGTDLDVFEAEDLLGMMVEFFTSEEFAIGAFLGGGFRGTLSSYEAIHSRYLDPATAATETDFKTLEKITSDEEVAHAVLLKTNGDRELAELAVRAKHGDKAAQAEYVERSTIDIEGDIAAAAKLTPEERAAFLESPQVVQAEQVATVEADASTGGREMALDSKRDEVLVEKAAEPQGEKTKYMAAEAKRDEVRQRAEEKVAPELRKRLKEVEELARTDAQAAVRAVEAIASQLPSDWRGRLTGYSRILNFKSERGRQNELARIMARMHELLDQAQARSHKRRLERVLKPFAATSAKKQRKALQRAGNEARDKLAFAAKLVSKPETETPKGMDESTADDLRNVFSGVFSAGASATRLRIALEHAEAIRQGGRTEIENFKEAAKQRRHENVDLALAEILKGETLKPQQELVNRRISRGTPAKVADMGAELFRGLNGLQQQINLLDVKRDGPLESRFYDPAIKADQLEVTLNRQDTDTLSTAAIDIFGSAKDAARWLKASKNIVQRTGVYYDAGNGIAQVPMSKGQAVSLWNAMRDQSLVETFEGMSVTQTTKKQVADFLGKEGLEFAQFLADGYAAKGAELQRVHRETEGFAMDLVENYGGRIYRVDRNTAEDSTMLDWNDKGRATVKSGSMKERSNITKAIVFKDAFDEFARHNFEMNHYISHAQLAKDLRGAFGNPKVMRAIEQRHGKGFKDSLDKAIGDIINGDIQREGWEKALNTLRANVTKGTLGLNASIVPKQLASWPALAETMTAKDYAHSMRKYLKDFPTYAREIIESEYIKNRSNTSMYRDLRQDVDARSGIGRGMTFSDVIMMGVKFGDVGAIVIGGGPIYVDAKTRALKEGRTESEAADMANDALAKAAERSQQSSAMHAQGSFLRGNALMRTFFMYATSPIQYQRNINVAAQNLLKAANDAKKGNKADVKTAAEQFGKIFAIYHVLLPQLFQAVASGFMMFMSDDEEVVENLARRQLKALYLGNGNVIPLFGQLADTVTSRLSGTRVFTGGAGSPLLDSMARGFRSIDGLLRDGFTIEHIGNLVDELGKSLGIPIAPVRNTIEGAGEVIEDDAPLLRMLNFSNYALGLD